MSALDKRPELTDPDQLGFQRARSPEQREARRRAILAVATELLTEMPLRDISLRELGRRVGLSKTNVVRYFETREAVYFALLLQSLDDWLSELPDELPGRDVSTYEVVDAWGASLARRPLICELMSALGTELERNLSVDAVREFKLAHMAWQESAAELVCARVPAFDSNRAGEFVSMTTVLTAGLWPFSRPAPSVAEALSDPRLARSRVDFEARLQRALRVTAAGLLTSPR